MANSRDQQQPSGGGREGQPSPNQRRLREVADQAIEALSSVVRSSKITEEELHAAGAFLNRVGQQGLFPTLLDIALGVVSSQTVHNAPGATRRILEGPFYKPGAPLRKDGSLLERPPSPGTPILNLTGRVTYASSGAAIPGAEIDLWQADEEGRYDVEGFHLRGVVLTDRDGTYSVRTILPGDYAQHTDDIVGELLGMMGRPNYRPGHIHLRVRVHGQERLVTQIFRSDSPHLWTDYISGAVSDDLLADVQPVDVSHGGNERVMHFDIAV